MKNYYLCQECQEPLTYEEEIICSKCKAEYPLLIYDNNCKEVKFKVEESEQKVISDTPEQVKPSDVVSTDIEAYTIPNLEDIGPIGGGIDLAKYDKEKTTIEDAEIITVKSGFTDSKTQWVLKVKSVVLESFTKDDGTKIEFRASELFNLVQEEKLKVPAKTDPTPEDYTCVIKGYYEGEKSHLMKFLKDIGMQDPKEFKSLSDIIAFVKGKEAVIKAYEKNDKTYLSFRY